MQTPERTDATEVSGRQAEGMLDRASSASVSGPVSRVALPTSAWFVLARRLHPL
jgi:hypothetical protein